MLFGCDVLLKRMIGLEDLDLSVEASTVDEVDDTDIDFFQLLTKPVSENQNHQATSERS